jgi:hypothetical protein
MKADFTGDKYLRVDRVSIREELAGSPTSHGDTLY